MTQHVRWLAASALLALLVQIPSAGAVQEEASKAEDANKANNPLTPAPALNLQNYYVPKLFDSDKYTNDLYVRGALPLPPMGVVPVPQLLRLTIPVSTRPETGGGYTTGIGDINIFDIFLLKTQGTQLGLGPLLTLPTASNDVLGTGKWQGGLAAIAIDPSPKRLLGGLVQWQASFAGDSARPDVNTLTIQPFLIYNLPDGWYLRSTATWTFDIKNDRYFIPVGLGAGKAWRVGKNIYNVFAEPQWTVAHDGAGFPQFAVFAGINVTFGH